MTAVGLVAGTSAPPVDLHTRVDRFDAVWNHRDFRGNKPNVRRMGSEAFFRGINAVLSEIPDADLPSGVARAGSERMIGSSDVIRHVGTLRIILNRLDAA